MNDKLFKLSTMLFLDILKPDTKMHLLCLLTLLVFLNSCNTDNTKRIDQASLLLTEFIEINSDSDLYGSILIYDLNHNTYYSNNLNWATDGRIPASTFKIPHSLIALELGIVDDENTLLKWNGEKRMYKIWQQDLTLKQAFHYSCVPCYQDIANKVGVGHMNEFMGKFNYGQMDIHRNNIDLFWLRGKSKINQFEQIDFLKRLYLSQLPISQRTEQIFKQLFITKHTDEYTLRAKTGLAFTDGKYNGWYVGYLEKNNDVYFFATNISPKENYDKSFNNKRKTITIKAFRQLGIFK